MKLLPKSFFSLAVASLANLIFPVQAISQTAHPDDPYYEKCQHEGATAAVRACMRELRNKEASNLGERACGSNKCIYKLNFHSRIKRPYIDTYTYKGGGFTLITGDPSVDSYSARLVDAKGRETILRMCGGNSCAGHYSYEQGPHNGADARGPFGGEFYKEWHWVLELPR